MPKNSNSQNQLIHRIVITGASGVGKTCLAEALAPHMGLPIIPEFAREICLDMGYQRIGEIPDQEGFKWKVMKAHIEAEKKLPGFISDRSMIDCWALWQRWSICTAKTYDTEAFRKEAKQQADTYTAIIYVPPMFPVPHDGFRWTDLDYQKQVDRLIRMTLFEWDLWDRTYTVKSDKLEERTLEVMSWLKACKT